MDLGLEDYLGMSTLCTRVTYRSEEELICNRITEYDISRANVTMMVRAGILSNNQLKIILDGSDHARKVLIGKLERRIPDLKKIISAGIADAKFYLFLTNQICTDEIQAIRNDAVFIIGRRLRHTEFGNIKFREKRVYGSYMRLDNLDIYRGKDGAVDIKGINDAILSNPDHQAGMLSILSEVMRLLEIDDRSGLSRYLIDTANAYKERRLPVECYRELGPANVYRTNIELGDHGLNFDHLGENQRDLINPIYNYRRFILPLINQFA